MGARVPEENKARFSGALGTRPGFGLYLNCARKPLEGSKEHANMI